MKTVLYAPFLAALVLCGTQSASASIVSITNGGMILEPPPANAGLPGQALADVTLGFNEKQNQVLPNPFVIHDLLANADVTLPTGSIVSSHMIVVDPIQLVNFGANITFDEPILGVIFTDARLFSSHAYFGRPGVSYPATAFGHYGLEPNDNGYWIDAYTLRIAFSAGVPGDRLRVITGTIPTPGAASLLGLGGLVAARRRRFV